MAITIKTNLRERRIEEGDILVGSYGYEASIAEWYRVVKRTPKMVTLQRLEGKKVATHGYEGWEEVPSDKPYEYFGEQTIIRRKVQPAVTPCDGYLDGYDVMESCWTESFIHAFIWDGEPVDCYNYH